MQKIKALQTLPEPEALNHAPNMNYNLANRRRLVQLVIFVVVIYSTYTLYNIPPLPPRQFQVFRLCNTQAFNFADPWPETPAGEYAELRFICKVSARGV